MGVRKINMHKLLLPSGQFDTENLSWVEETAQNFLRGCKIF